TRPAAHATGFPPKVEACAPGGQLITSARAMVAESGIPLAMPFATARMSGDALKCSAAHIFPVRPIPDCTSSNTSSIPKRLALHGFARCKRKRPHRPPVKCAQKRDELVATRRIVRHLDGRLNGFRAGIAEVDAPLAAPWRKRRQLLGKGDHVLVVEVRAGHVD